MPCCSLRNRIHNWLRDYARLQSHVVILIYAQIGCALIGSLGALYNGVSLINLTIALFALVAIESNCQSLVRTYAVLLICAILLDISWFLLFSKEIWNISSEVYQASYIFSIKLTMAMEIAGFVVRLSSSLLWFRIYRLGASVMDTPIQRQSDLDLQSSFLEPPLLARQGSNDPELRNSFLEPPAIAKPRSDDILGDTIHEPACYTPLLDNDDQSNVTSPKATQGLQHTIKITAMPLALFQSRLDAPYVSQTYKIPIVLMVVKYHSAGDIYKGPHHLLQKPLETPLSRYLEALDCSLR